ncbi:unnamed protein product [Pleuronectes platessa]|uniref:Uncharacterized protein n=1 Tax=Pleuronectes platessa TaxID=8262 RepID=A0A9N7URD1_PLEPL|nr:unnamed protein product [Pleuronectes platessa]
MGGRRTPAQVLLLSAVGVVCLSTLVSTMLNTTSGPDPPQNSQPTPSSGYQKTCQAENLRDASHRVSTAVDTLAVELSCKGRKNGNLSKDKSMELEQNLRKILDLTLKVFFDLSGNESGFNVLDIFGILDSLSLGNHSDPGFLRLWFSLKMAPLLPHVDESFLISLSQQNFSCTAFRELVGAMGEELETSERMKRKLIYTSFIKAYLSRKNLSDPGCTKQMNQSEEWLQRYIGNFFVYASLEDLKEINPNFKAEEVLGKLSPNQKAELILDPDSGALRNETIVREVFKSLNMSNDDNQLSLFFLAFTRINMQKNITLITNPAVRGTILNLTLTALAQRFKDFEPEDFTLWFQCKQTLVDENLICAAANRSQLDQTLSIGNSSEAMCNVPVVGHACSSATHLTPNNLARLVFCTLESDRTYPVEAGNNSFPALSNALDALGEVRITNFTQAQLQSGDFVKSRFQTLRPLLASPSSNFLFCLSAKNFSCQSYQTVIQVFSNQRQFMERKIQRRVFTHFVKPFLSRNDSSDPGCVSSVNGSAKWLQANIGGFSEFAALHDLLGLNPNFSSAESLSVLTPTQVAQLPLTSGASNDTDQIDRVFERLEEGNAVDNVAEFLTELTAEEKDPDFQPFVRDRVMNRTFQIISPHFLNFKTGDWFVWFNVRLVPFLASFSAVMLENATSTINCTNYHVVVSGMNKALPKMRKDRRNEISDVLLGYLTKSASVVTEPGCRQGIQSDAQWLEVNLGGFVKNRKYSELKVFNLSVEAVLVSLSPDQKAELILDPDSGALRNETIVREVFKSLNLSHDDNQLQQFFLALTRINMQKNITLITNPAVRGTILNLTLTALVPGFKDFEPEDFTLWFQVNLATVMASIHPGSLVVIPSNISCTSFAAILTGLVKPLESLPLPLSHDVRSAIASFKETFPDCAEAESLMCKQTLVDENLICAAANRSQLDQTLSIGNSSEAMCNVPVVGHACSSATHLTPNNLARLVFCTLESDRTYPVEVWKLLFQKALTSVDRALDLFATMAGNNSFPALSNALDALGEVRITNFTQAQLQSGDFVKSRFQTLRPLLASPSSNFLFCLSAKNFSCQSYQTVIQVFSNQRQFMERKIQRRVFTHFVKPFLSRNDSSDPGCVSSVNGSAKWLQANIGGFSEFAALHDLLGLNPNFSSAESLSVLTPTQVAQLPLTSGASNDTDQIDRVFERLEEGNAVDNVAEFLTELTAEEKDPDFQPFVRDRVMNRTFQIISPHFLNFKTGDWFVWFNVRLVPFLASFSAVMLENATSTINCTNYHVVVSGMNKALPKMRKDRRNEISDVLLGYLTKSASVVTEPGCRQGIQSDAQWLEVNLGGFVKNRKYSELKVFNLSVEAVLVSLSPDQKAELILDPDSGALRNETIVREVFKSLNLSHDDNQLQQFFLALTRINMQKNITLITNPAVRGTILNLTLTALVPGFKDFEPEDFTLWFQVNLATVMASIHPGSLVVIPSNISCTSFAAILTGLVKPLESLPLPLSHDVRSAIASFKETFPDCAEAESLMCKQTLVDENLICAAANRSQLDQTLSIGNSSEAMCNVPVVGHACSSATHLTPNNLARLVFCTLESDRTYPVEVWKLLFQKALTSVDRALDLFATMAGNNSFPALSNALDALGEVRITNFTQAQLQSGDFVKSRFQTLRPLLASPSSNFLFCLSAKNFSCQSYQTVIQVFSNQRQFMERKIQRRVFTHFVKPFLSRNDSSDPGCVSSVNGSAKWLQANIGGFSEFAALHDLLGLNPNFSSAESLSVLTPTQVAQLPLTSGASNDTDQIDRVFERLEEGNAVDNVAEFLTELTAEEKDPDFQPFVRDRVMNRTFQIISPHFLNFKTGDWFVWFNVRLVPFLASFSAVMLENATSTINCTNYHVVVSGMNKALPKMRKDRRNEISDVLLGYLTKSASVVTEPGCRQGIQSDAQWLEVNLGGFVKNRKYSELKVFNLSVEAVLVSLSPDQKAELILDPDSGALRNETIVREVFKSLNLSHDDNQLQQFFLALTRINMQKNITLITNPAVRGTILNLTLTALVPGFKDFEPEDFTLWFQVNLATVMASIHPGSLVVIPSNISCTSFAAILTGLVKPLESLPLPLSHDVRSAIASFKETFPDCAEAESLMCKQTLVDENLICAAANRSQLDQTLSIGNSSEAMCNVPVIGHACSSATHLTPNNLARLVFCTLESDRTYPVEVWKLLFQKALTSVDRALDLFATMAGNNSFPALSNALDALGEVRITNFTQAQLQSGDFVKSRFQTLRPLLASPSSNFLFCLSAKNFSCQSYQTVIQVFSNQRQFMERKIQRRVFTHFVKPFLSRNDSSDPGCVSSVNGSTEWLQANIGGFSEFAALRDLQGLNPNFSSVEVADLFTFDQLASYAAIPSQLKTKQEVIKIMAVIKPVDYGAFFDTVSPAIETHPANYTLEVKSAFLQAIYDRGNLSSPTINDSEFLLWLRVRLRPLLVDLSPSLLLSTITASELNQLLSQPNMIDNNSDICVIFNNYNNTPAFLENEDVPDNVKMATLPCVWPLALNSKTKPEVESWFVHRLRNYLKFLNKSLISPTVVQNATCLAFQRLVSVMGTNFTYNNSEFGQGDVYTTIKTYLSSGSGPRCYNAKDQELNSTSWFVNYIGSFVTFITPDDLATFISSSQAKVFLEDRANLELFNNTAIPENVTDFYISQLFELNPTFNLRELPGAFLCSNEVPIGAYTSVNEKDTLLVLKEMATFCNTTVNPEASTALASNIQTITPATFATLGSASAALTTSKITSIDPTVLVSSLSTLSAVDTWSLVQASTIIQIMIAGGFQIKSASSLESLGTLVSGVPSNSIEAVPASELLKVSKSPAFVSSMLTATVVVQQTFVKKIVSIDPSPAKVVLNVPDAMASHIAPSLLVFTNETVDISVMNRKTWTPDQAALFFGTLDTSSFDTEQLSPSMLQGFTCTSAQKMKRSKVRGLVRACRSRKSRAKVVLKQSQLTCMYNLLKGNLSQNFGDYPSDMLLYFKKGDVKKANCRSYISAVGAADFTVASSILNKGSLLLSEAKTCLDIKDSTLSRDNVEVMGNMACTLDGDYIRNADPLILEKLKVCKNLSDSQVVSIEWLLLNRTTPYGDVNTWTKQTLNDLGSLPLYFTKDIWGKLKHKTKKMHLKKFMPRLRKSKTKKRKLKHLFKQMSASKRKRGAGCTVGNITQLTASDPSFPFGYDAMQFDLCLDVPVLKDNLNSICEKVDDDDFQTIILKKLNQAYPSGVADNEVQMLGSVSRRASIDNISKWSITKIGTLAALMDVGDGPWEAAESKAIITSYLNSSGETLDSTVLNTIGLNLCSLDVSTLMSITPESIRNADPLNMASCSSEQKRVLYEISKTAFSSQRNNSGIFYNLIKSSSGGAPLLDVEQLSTQGINMDVLTFTSLDPSVITALNVTTVQDLMGSHVSDLELFAKHPVVQNWVNSRLQPYHCTTQLHQQHKYCYISICISVDISFNTCNSIRVDISFNISSSIRVDISFNTCNSIRVDISFNLCNSIRVDISFNICNSIRVDISFNICNSIRVDISFNICNSIRVDISICISSSQYSDSNTG